MWFICGLDVHLFPVIFMLQGAMLLMMGTADELPKEPVQKTVFMEDMTEQQLASAVRIENLFITNQQTDLCTQKRVRSDWAIRVLCCAL